MNKFVKSVLALGISSALSLSMAQAAKYEVIDKGGINLVKYSYAQQENNQGQMAISGSDIYNFPVQYQYLDDEDFDDIVTLADGNHENVHALNNIEDEVALRAGNPTGNDLAWVVRFFNERANTTLYQREGAIVAMRNLTGDAGDTEPFVVFDEYFPDTTTLTRSTTDYVNGITNDGWIYGNGSAPYMPLNFVANSGEELVFWVREFTSRAYFSPDAGETIYPLLPPTESDTDESLRLGGESAILDISESLFAVGYASTSIDQDSLDKIAICVANEVEREQETADGNTSKIPYEVCIQNLKTSMYSTEAIKWKISIDGVTSSETLGHLVTQHEDDESELVNVAQAVNSNGVAVGYATGWQDEKETNPSKFEKRSLYAVVYKNGEVKDFTDNHTEFFDSRAYDINDSGIAIGHVKTYVNGSIRSKFYHVDTNDFDSGMTMIRPDDFFNGSSSTARAINENGVIVGEGEVETHNDGPSAPRRKHAFMYDIPSKTFTDLNDLLTCESDYTIIEARDINDNNEISASALVKSPRRDAKGELMFDVDTGEQLTEDVVRAVTLKPIVGEIEVCSTVEEKVKRQGAGLGFISFFALLTFGFTRKFLNRS
jgi:uncharacterized membrane protein